MGPWGAGINTPSLEPSFCRERWRWTPEVFPNYRWGIISLSGVLISLLQRIIKAESLLPQGRPLCMPSPCQLGCPGTVDVLGSDRNALLTESFPSTPLHARTLHTLLLRKLLVCWAKASHPSSPFLPSAQWGSQSNLFLMGKHRHEYARTHAHTHTRSHTHTHTPAIQGQTTPGARFTPRQPFNYYPSMAFSLQIPLKCDLLFQVPHTLSRIAVQG